jgi:hypothetical protein
VPYFRTSPSAELHDARVERASGAEGGGPAIAIVLEFVDALERVPVDESRV